jgi:hypothetical protein
MACQNSGQWTFSGFSPQRHNGLKRALRAEVDEGEWSKLYSTISLPFETASKIAVKVINHYGMRC